MDVHASAKALMLDVTRSQLGFVHRHEQVVQRLG
jgi:hypothetical protein